MQDEATLNLRWDFFSSHLMSIIDLCFQRQHFVDITLACKDGAIIKCHKMILASASGYFRRLLVNNEHPHPMLILCDVEAHHLQTIINFIYFGEIEVAKSEVSRLLMIAEKLEIAGLKDIRASTQFNKNYGSSTPSPPISKSAEKSTERISKSKGTEKLVILKAETTKTTEEPSEAPIPEPSTNAKPGLKSNYNLRQRSKLHKHTNNVTKPQVNKKNEVRNPPKTVIQNNERPVITKGQKEVLKRPLEQCQYLRRLRLLDEVEIIKKSYPIELSSPGINSSSSLNCGIFIKDEVDISSSDEDSTIPKKRHLSPGVEIFRTHNKKIREPMASTSQTQFSFS